jgi:four helix bundle protein
LLFGSGVPYLSVSGICRRNLMAFKFENLNIWHYALELSVGINELATIFPSLELYNLSNQIRKAADSVVLNIAEGCTGQSNPEFSKFLAYALRSAIEVVSCLFIAKRKGYIDDLSFVKHYNDYEILCRMISKLRNSLFV